LFKQTEEPITLEYIPLTIQ